MMEWLVCQSRLDGELYVQSREEREWLINTLMLINERPRSFVIKKFYDIDDAIKYLEEIKFANSVIKKAIE